ncbi:hypothetical protein HMPREF0262_02657 [Clostridium sp. ATCC 29733]|nr:hypothetical protein HMPREF0262_02657 [Clostridium sp. ATCC 29733]
MSGGGAKKKLTNPNRWGMMKSLSKTNSQTGGWRKPAEIGQ